MPLQTSEPVFILHLHLNVMGHLYACTCGGTRAWVHAHACACVWRPEADVRSHFDSSSTLIIEAGALNQTQSS